jgi:HK97 family phage portal protein
VNPLRRILHSIAVRATSYWSDKLSWGGLAASWGAPALSGVAVTDQSALTLTAYYAGVMRIATDVAALPVGLYRRRADGGRDEVRDHPVVPLLTVSPDGERTAFAFRQAWLSHAVGGGNGYAEIRFDGDGFPRRLDLLDYRQTSPERRSQDDRLFYRSGSGTVPASRMLHVAGLGFDGIKGYSPVALFKEALGLGMAAERYGAAWFGNGSRPGGIIEIPGGLKDAAERERLRNEWAKIHGGPENAGKPAVLTGGATFKPFQVGPEEAQFLQTRQFQVLEVCRMLGGLPPHKLGDYSQAHLTNIEASNIDYVSMVLLPWAESVEQVLNLKLLTADERAQGLYLEHNLNGYLRGDSRARAEFYRALMSMGVITPNEIRKWENLNPIDGADFTTVPLNVAILQDGQFTVLAKGQADPPAPDAASVARALGHARTTICNGHAN